MTDQQVTDLRKLPKHERNPFLRDYSSGKPRYALGTSERHLVIDRTSGKEAEKATFVHAIPTDREPFVKLYAEGVAKIAGLSKVAARVMEMLMLQASKHHDEDKLHATFQIAERTMPGMTRTTFQRGMKELAIKEIIGKTPIEGLWWLNPDIMFNGNRLEIKRVYIKRKDDDRQLDLEKYLELTADAQDATE